MNNSPFLQSIREYMPVRRYRKRTITTYLHWIKRYILFTEKSIRESALSPRLNDL